MSKLVNELLATDKKLADVFESRRLSIEISDMLVEARYIKGITQGQLAEMIDTKQSSIARFESGKTLPSLRFLEKIAKALKTELIPPKFAFLAKDFQVNAEETTTVNKIQNWKINLGGMITCPTYLSSSVATANLTLSNSCVVNA